MPIKRFGSTLISHGEFSSYMTLLKTAHQDDNIESVMCRSLISIDWQGYVYDCDFNQMLDMPLQLDHRPRLHITELAGADLCNQSITSLCHWIEFWGLSTQ